MKKTIEETNKKIKISRKAGIHLIVFLVLLAFMAGCYIKLGVVATVNGKPIYRWSYISKLQKSDSKSVLNQMIQEKLINDEAKKNNVVIDQKEIDDALAQIKEQVEAQGITLEEAMKSEGITEKDLINQIRTQKIAEKLAVSDAEITQEQIDAFLKENKSSLPTGKTKAELQTLAKEELEAEAKNTALSTWYSNLAKSAKIIYR
jgi:foldase protein PrsA